MPSFAARNRTLISSATVLSATLLAIARAGAVDQLPYPSATNIPAIANDTSFGDLNGDGYIDVVTGNYPYFGQYQNTPPSSTAGNQISTSGRVDIVKDVNADGRDDYVILDHAVVGEGQSALQVTLATSNVSSGSFIGGNAVCVAALGTTFSHVQSVQVDSEFGYRYNINDRAVTVDLNMDGKPDLVVMANDDSGFGHVFVFLQQSNGTFNSTPDYDIQVGDRDSFTAFTVGDYDGDGHPDLLFATTNYGDEPSNVYALVASAAFDGTPTPVLSNIAATVTSLSLGDLNGDGHPDVVVNEYYDGEDSFELVYGDDANANADTVAAGTAALLPHQMNLGGTGPGLLWLNAGSDSGLCVGQPDSATSAMAADEFTVDVEDPANTVNSGTTGNFTVVAPTVDLDNNGFLDLILVDQTNDGYANLYYFADEGVSLTGASTIDASAGFAPVSLAPYVSVDDQNDLTGVVVTLANPPDGANELLTVDTSGEPDLTAVVTPWSATTPSVTVTITGADNSDDYTNAIRSITYQDQIFNGTAGQRTVTIQATDGVFAANADNDVDVQLDQAPVAPSATFAVTAGTASQGFNVDASDPDSGPQALAYEIVAQGAHGTATIDQGGNFIYTSDGSSGVTDAIPYAVYDGYLSSTGTITVVVPPTLPVSVDTGVFVPTDDISTGDVTGDGITSLMTGNMLYPGAANTPPDSASATAVIATSGRVQIVPDLTGDGMDDYVVLSTAYDDYAGQNELTVELHASNHGADGGVVFTSTYTDNAISSLDYWSESAPEPFLARAFSVDINQDGKPDLVVAINDDYGDGHLLVWLQGSKGFSSNSNPDYDLLQDTNNYDTIGDALVAPVDSSTMPAVVVALNYYEEEDVDAFHTFYEGQRTYGYLEYFQASSDFTEETGYPQNDYGTQELTAYGVFDKLTVGDLDHDGWPDFVGTIYDNSTGDYSWELVYGAANYQGLGPMYGNGEAYILPSFDANPQADLWLYAYGSAGIAPGILDAGEGVKATPDQYGIARTDPGNWTNAGYRIVPINADIDNDGYHDLMLATTGYSGNNLRLFPHTPSFIDAPYSTQVVGGDAPAPMIPDFSVDDNAPLQTALVTVESPDPAYTTVGVDTTGTALDAVVSNYQDDSGSHIAVAISGVGSNDDWNTVFQSLTFQDSATQPSAASATVAFTADDGIFSSTGAAVVDIVTDQAPVAQGGSLSLDNGATATGSALASDPDNGPDALTYAILTDPILGSVSIDPNSGVYTYSATAAGMDSFVYAVSDGVLSATATITVAIDAVPIAQSATAAINAGGTVDGNLVATDSDGGPQPLSYAIATQPAHGVVTLINAATGAYSYVNDGTAGADAFTFTATDGEATSLPATVTIAVNALPVIPANTFSILPGTTATGHLVATDSDGPQPLTYAILGNPEQGTVTLLDPTTGAFSYQANLSATGSDSFAFTASDGAATTTGSVLVTYAADQAPVAQGQAISATSGAVTTGNLVASDSDGPQALVFAVSEQPAHGIVTINAATGAFSLAANENAVGTDSFAYTVTDGILTATATVTITYQSSGPQPLTALIGGQSPAQPFAAALGQAIDVFAINGIAPYTLSSAQAVALPDTTLITNTDLNGDGRPDSGEHITLIPIVPGTGSMVITDSTGATVAVTFTATALPSVAVAPPPVALSPANATIYTAICPGTEQGLANFEAALAGHDNTQVAAFAWNPAAQAFQPVTATTTGLLPSQAIFLATRVDLGLDFSGNQAPVPYTIPLQPGWNFVGVPPLESASATAPLLDHDLNADFTLTDTAGDVISGSQRDAAMGTAAYLWDGTTYDDETVLHTGQGYWIKNNTTAPGQTLLLKRVASGTGQRAVAKSVQFHTVDIGAPPAPPGNGADSATDPADGGGGGCGLGSGAAGVFLAALAFWRGGFLRGGSGSSRRRNERS